MRTTIDSYKSRTAKLDTDGIDFDQFRETVKTVGLYWLLINQPPVAEGLYRTAGQVLGA